eukprot:TRINITY_DN33268_c0_g1_i1.p1 TRINITY_DN33268_c0_g1~~TRINITY_DN33268_c0_g1_i1.p1  ORF type:complete len:2088 (-),score=389.74 TRINITY_DN33268_c0_g1_i1:106-6069(-)
MQSAQRVIIGSDSRGSDSGDARCQSVAIIRSLSEDIEGVEKVMVTVHDIHAPGVELRCEVYLARIDRIEVETRVRRINVEDVETIAVKAYDKQGNVFSSLEGLQFDWRIGDTAILERPDLRNTNIKLSPTRRALSESGVQPDTVLLKGKATGKTTIGATLLSRSGTPVVSPDVLLAVSENIIMLPSLIRALPLAEIELQLKILKGPRQPLDMLPAIRMPVEHLSWSQEALEGGSDILFVDPALGRVVTQRLGRARVVAIDNRIENNTASSLVYVAPPKELRFWPLPLWKEDLPTVSDSEATVSVSTFPTGWRKGVVGDWEEVQQRLLADSEVSLRSTHGFDTKREGPWQFVRGRTYALKLEILDDSSQEMHVPSNFRADARCEAKPVCPLQLIRQSSNSAVLIFRAMELGEGEIVYGNSSMLVSLEDEARGLRTSEDEKRILQKLVARHAFEVVEPLQPLADFAAPMVLPTWHAFTLTVKGGSGEHLFALRRQEPQGVAAVRDDGRVQAFGKTGQAELIVSDARNPDNNFTMPVLVRRAGSLQLLPRYLQLQLPTSGVADEDPVLVIARPEILPSDKGGDGRAANLSFWNCSEMFVGERLSVEVSDDKVATWKLGDRGQLASDRATRLGSPCAVILVRPLASGSFKLVARGKEADIGKALPDASLPFQVFRPLRLDLPAAVLAPGSSTVLRFAEGPGELTVGGHEVRNVTSDKPAHVLVRRLPAAPGEEIAFEIVGLQPTTGPVKLLAEVSQRPAGDMHGELLVVRATTEINCAVPAQVQVVAKLPGKEDVDIRSRNLTLQRGLKITFSTRFLDEAGREIFNASAFQPHWSLSGSEEVKGWLKVKKKDPSLAVLQVPRDADRAAFGNLHLEVALHTQGSDEAAKRYLAGLQAPKGDDVRFNIAGELELRWPGFPEKPRFAYSPNTAYVLEAGFGTGEAVLAISASHGAQPGEAVFEIVEESKGCDQEGAVEGECVRVVKTDGWQAGARVKRWLLRPVGIGKASISITDPDLLGAEAKELEISFQPAERLKIALRGKDAPAAGQAALVISGKLHPLQIEVEDAEGQPLHPLTWPGLGLQLRSNDPVGLETSREDPKRPGEYKLICHSPGQYEVEVLAHAHPRGTIRSKLLVRCLSPPGFLSDKVVVMPGQVFEIGMATGLSTDDEHARLDFISSNSDVANVSSKTGLVTALRPGKTVISSRLLERGTGQEIARAQADVTVIKLKGASIEPSPVPQLVRGAEEPQQVRAALRGDGMELSPLLLAADASGVGPAHATDEAAAAGRKGCTFQWTSNDTSVTVVPASAGAAAHLAASMEGEQVGGIHAQVLISVRIDCPKRAGESPTLSAQTVVTVVWPLLLLSPTPSGRSDRVVVPPGGRLTLRFSLPKEQLQVDLLGDPTLQLQEMRGLTELVAGNAEGHAMLLARDRDGRSKQLLQVALEVRTPVRARIRVPDRMPLYSTALAPIDLVDANGRLIVLPPNFDVSLSSSHSSVISSDGLLKPAADVLETSPDGTLAFRLKAQGEGCALLHVVVRLPDQRNLTSAQEKVCVSRGALAGLGPLLLQPGDWLNLSAELIGAGDSSGRSPPWKSDYGGGVRRGATSLHDDDDDCLKACQTRCRHRVNSWSSSQPEVLEVTGDGLFAVAKGAGSATLHFNDGVVSANLTVDVSPAGKPVPKSVPEGGPSPALAAARVVSNEVPATGGSSPLRVTFELLPKDTTLRATGQDEFSSGPFISRESQLLCKPMEASLGDFFDFEVSSTTCLLQPRRMDVRKWVGRLAPTKLTLFASAGGQDQGSTLQWPFVPQFAAMDAAGEQLLPGAVCATLSPAKPTSSVEVWTGGHPVQASLLGQIQDARRGNISMQVDPDPADDSWASIPTVSFRLVWNGPVSWGQQEEVELRVVSPVTGQVMTFQVLVTPSGKACDTLPVDAGRSGFELLLLATGPLALLWVAISRLGPSSSVSLAERGADAGHNIFGADAAAAAWGCFQPHGH